MEDKHDIEEKDRNVDREQLGKENALPGKQSAPAPVRRHLIRPAWLRIPLKILMWIIIVVLCIPVLVYLPPVQDLAIGIVSKQVKKSTGMEIGIGRFRLKFPLDVELRDVYVLTAAGDTMVRAGEAVADVKLMPLFNLDVRLNKLDLENGYYRMVSADSSMIMAIRAGHLTADDKSSVDIRTMRIILNKVRMRDGDVSLFMDVWKKKKNPEDTAKSTPIYIQANDLELENFGFGMSMLPTIDTLDLRVNKLALLDGVVDLGANKVSWKEAAIGGGKVKYITPDPKWAKAHPAPPSEPSSGPPMVIQGKRIAVDNLAAIYATKGVKPAAGFDPSYISVTDVVIGMNDFYNESSTVRLPITELRARERSGLQITECNGTVSVDSVGLRLSEMNLVTLFSRISADAEIPFAVMALDQHTPMGARADGYLGLPDIEAFMPAVKSITAKVPRRKPLKFDVDAHGTLARLSVERLKAEMAGVFRINAHGFADNALNYKKMKARINLDGALMEPSLAHQFLPESEMRIPAFRIKGTAEANGLSYGANLALTTTAGNLAAKGHVMLTPERYEAAIDATHLNVAAIMPSLGIGPVTARIDADGAGFNPLSGHAYTHADVDISAIEYKGNAYRDITGRVVLERDGNYTLQLNSANPGLDLYLDGTGSIHPDDYFVNMEARINDLDLKRLGFSDSICNGNGIIFVSGSASPGRWLYDADIRVENFDWNLPGRYIHLPYAMHAVVKSDEFSTALDIDSDKAGVRFRSPSGLKNVVDCFMASADTVMRQVNQRNLAINNIRETLPPFSLDIDASGNGILGQLLCTDGLKLDTIWGHVERDSLISGNINLLALNTSSFQADTLTLNLKERGALLDYQAHMGNRKGNLDEFADVSIRGYLGHNRLGAYLVQHNIKGEMGYRLGLTASVMDSVVNVHFTPLKATIAYLPWTFNNDNFLSYNFRNMQVEGNLKASSAESSILALTEPDEDGNTQLKLKIENLHVQDFTRLIQDAPPVKATVNSDLTVHYAEEQFSGQGSLNVSDFIYDKQRVGDFDFDINGGYSMKTGAMNGAATLKVNGKQALMGYASMTGSSDPEHPDSVGVRLTHFPLALANPFLGKMASLSGTASGDMRMNGDLKNPKLDGFLKMEKARVNITMAGASLAMDSVPITVDRNIVHLDGFDIWGANNNPLTLNGTIDAGKLTDVLVDVTAKAANMQLINSDKRSKADIFGKIFLNLDANAKGPLSRLDVNATLNMLGSTDATYRLNMSPTELQTSGDQDVVRFVNFNDTVQTAMADSTAVSSLNMRINAHVQISPGTHLEVLLSTNGTDKVSLSPTANLNYYQSYIGDMSLTGTLTLGNGFARYAIPVAGEKMFDFAPTSTITWTGNVMNPILNVTATDKMKANVTTDGNSRLVDFLVTLHATNQLERLKVSFDLSTNDDLAIDNQLKSMSDDQRQTQAMNLLLYGQYTGMDGTKGNANIGGNLLYSFLESQLNSWAAKNIRGVDLSFGVNQYEKASNGTKSTETSYSYQVSKSLFNNRFKIQVGGNYSTDQSAEDNLAQNLVSDISFEYIIKQTQSMSTSLQLFRRQNYESMLEGEITETGVAFVWKRKLGNLLRLFRRRRKRKPQVTDTVAVREVKEIPAASAGCGDTINTGTIVK